MAARAGGAVTLRPLLVLGCALAAHAVPAPFASEHPGGLASEEVRTEALRAALEGQVPAVEGGPRRLQQLGALNLPPIKVCISNAGPTVDTWQVYEVQFFFGTCIQNRQIPGAPTLASYSSGTRPENVQDIADLATDGSIYSKWTAQCFNGCRAYDAYVGVDITSTQDWLIAQKPNHTNEDVRVRCVRFFQSGDYRYRAEKIALQEVRYQLPNLLRVDIELYDDAAGGIWSRRPAQRDTLWRLSNLGPIPAFWTLSEVRFYLDELCSIEIGPDSDLRGTPFTTGSFLLKTNYADLLWDENADTTWIATCKTPQVNSTQLGCSSREAAIGLDFGDTAVAVRCVRVYQTPQKRGGISTTQTHTRGFALQHWDGVNKYTDAERFWDITWKQFTVAGDIATLATPFLGLGAGSYYEGRWEDSRGPNRSAVRLTNDDYTNGAWVVDELEFYQAVDCSGDKLKGASLSMAGPLARNVSDFAFDGDLAPELFWNSSCVSFSRNHSDPGACDRQEAWLGMYFRPTPGLVLPNVSCFRLVQARVQVNQATSVNLWSWLGGQWVIQSNHRDLGGGWWNRRPAEPFSMWRLTNHQGPMAQWRVVEVRAYRDPLCLNETTPGVPIGSGALNYNDMFTNAFDDASATSWGADCLVCNDTHKYWVGSQLPAGADDVLKGERFVQCIRIWQSERAEQQVSVVRLDIWNGGDWTDSPFMTGGIAMVSGGGSWFRQPAAALTKWRMTPVVASSTVWRLVDVEFYTDPGCSRQLRSAGVPGGATISISGFKQEEQLFVSGLVSEGSYAVDGLSNTTFAMQHLPGRPAWFGIDYLSERAYVRCVKLRQGPLAQEQAQTVRMEAWDGEKFSPPRLAPREVTLEGLGGGGWQRRPAGAGTLWRLVNLDFIPEGWAVYEVQFHSDLSCGTGNWTGLGEGLGPEAAISSGYAPSTTIPLDKHGPQKAFDKDLTSAWLSQCSKVQQGFSATSRAVGCQPRAAWVGLDLGMRPQEVRCFRLLQVGYKAMQTADVALSKWDGIRWQDVSTFNGMGGSTWNQRPAGPNSMWRIRHTMDKQSRCRGQMNRLSKRSWGVAELEFYSDDQCRDRIRGGAPIASGTIEAFRQTITDSASYDLGNAMDGNVDTVWAANCNFGFEFYNATRVDCGDEWLGVDYGATAVEVKCIRIMQSRLESPNCCDPAEGVRLERWNGTDWLEATWRHDPPPGAHQESRFLGASFENLGQCPKDSSTAPIYMARIWEKRARRDSDNCIVTLTGATVLLGDKYCVQHPACAAAIGDDGTCCPVGDGSTSESRCCCTYLQYERVYADEDDQNPLKRDFQLEYSVIQMSTFLPIICGALGVAAYIVAVTFPPTAQDSVVEWSFRLHGERLWCTRLRRAVAFMLWPALAWRSWLHEASSTLSVVACWFCLPQPGRTRPKILQAYRFFGWVALCAWSGGAMPWILIGGALGYILLRVLLVLSLIVRVAASPFDPNNERDMKLRDLISGVPLKQDSDTARGAELLYGFMGCAVLGVVYFMKFIFDILVLRAHMISYGVVDTIEGSRIVDIFPGAVSILRDPGMVVYAVILFSDEVLSMILSFLMGIPRCEGASVLIASTTLVMVIASVGQWLNFDLFGLMAAATQAVKRSRPECQRILVQGGVAFSLALQFAAVQCAMVMFTRSLALANPFKTMLWMCPYNDLAALIIGKAFIIVVAILGLGFVFLCSNGHFLGQDYLLEPVMKWLHIDLLRLDPDGTGPTGGWVRWDMGFSVLPTMAGVWLDGWNVRGFLVKERASIYSDLLQDPQPCQHCGKIHVKYQSLMMASGRQAGLAMQCLPFGILVGKSTEYFNDPPLFYWGKELACARPLPMVAPESIPDLGKGRWATKALLFSANACTLMVEIILPLARRLVTILLYVLALLGTFTVNEKNLVDWGGKVIEYAFYASFVKAACEVLLEVVFSFLIGIIYAELSNQVHVGAALQNTVVRTVAGQALSGASVSSMLCTLLQDSTPVGMWGSIVLAAILGWVFSLLILAVNISLELPPLAPEDPPYRAPFPTVVKAGVALGSGVCMALVAGQAVQLRVAIGAAIAVAGIQAIVLKLVLLERRPRPMRDDVVHQDEGVWKASPTIIVFNSVRFLPGLVAIPTGALVGGLIASQVGTDHELRLGAAATCGLIVATVVVLAINKFQDNTAQLAGFFAGLLVWVLVLQWNLMAGLIAGVVVFAVVGSLLEQHELKGKVAELRMKWQAEDKLKMLKGLPTGDLSMQGNLALCDAGQPTATREERLALALHRVAEEQAEKAFWETQPPPLTPSSEAPSVAATLMALPAAARRASKEDTRGSSASHGGGGGNLRAAARGEVLAIQPAETGPPQREAPQQSRQPSPQSRQQTPQQPRQQPAQQQQQQQPASARQETPQSQQPTPQQQRQQQPQQRSRPQPLADDSPQKPRQSAASAGQPPPPGRRASSAQEASPLSTSGAGRRTESHSSTGPAPADAPATAALAASAAATARSSSRAAPLAIVDNFHTDAERQAEDEHALTLHQDVWSPTSQAPGELSLQGSGTIKRKTRAAPVKPSLWGAVMQPPPNRHDTGTLAAIRQQGALVPVAAAPERRSGPSPQHARAPGGPPRT